MRRHHDPLPRRWDGPPEQNMQMQLGQFLSQMEQFAHAMAHTGGAVHTLAESLRTRSLGSGDTALHRSRPEARRRPVSSRAHEGDERAVMRDVPRACHTTRRMEEREGFEDRRDGSARFYDGYASAEEEACPQHVS